MEEVFKKLKKEIDKYEVISFDIFDTLIKRNCSSPLDIFRLVEFRYKKLYKKDISSFHKKRVEAEKIARERSNKEEINFDEIYECIEYSKNDIEKLKKIEIECELDLCQKNQYMYDVYEYCKKKNKKIICISDMYLSMDIIKNILNKNDYDIKHVYVSSEIKKTKLTGNLFKYVIEHEKINKNSILHIGDSWKADFIAPIKKGIRPYHIKKKIDNCKFLKIDSKDSTEYRRDLNVNIITNFVNNNTLTIKDNYEKLGYEIVGPFCLMFSSWINEISDENNFDNLLFCARDTKMLQSIYELYYGDKRKSTYFYVSRKSIYLPYLYINNNFQSFKSLIPKGKRKININELLELYNIHIDDEKINKCLNEVKLDYKPLNFEEKDNLLKLEKLYNILICDYIEYEGKKQYNYFLKYLKKLDCNEKTAIVDLGWRGTTQNIMIDIINTNLFGLYFGLHSLNGKNLKNNYFTYLFKDKNDDYSKKIYPIMAICELTLSALHGSTIKYSESSTKPYVLGNTVNQNNEFINKIQTGAMKFCSSFVKLKNYLEYNDSKFFANEYIKIGLNPSIQQAKIIGDIYTENIKVRKLCEYKNIIYYVFHIKNLKRDFIDSEWKIGFLKRLFKVPLPYYKIYSFLKKKTEETR